MSEIVIHNWKEVSNEGNDFYFIRPVYHVTWWAVRRWWYKGDNSPYESCSRVDFTGGYQIYIDGTTPRMHLKIEWDGKDMKFTDERDIKRVLICQDLGAVTRGETTLYMDIEYVKSYPKFEIKFDGLDGSIDVPIDDPVVFTKDPEWDPANDYDPDNTIVAYTGVFIGGTPTIVSRARFQTKAQDDIEWTDIAWIEDVGENQPQSFVIPSDVTEVRFQHQVTETDLNRITNKWTSIQSINQPPPIIVCTPLNLLPDLGDSATGQRVCYEGETLIVEDLELLPS